MPVLVTATPMPNGIQLSSASFTEYPDADTQ